MIEKKWFDAFQPERDIRDQREFSMIFRFFMMDDLVKGSMLDVGCGYGSFDEKLVGFGLDLVGADLSRQMLRKNQYCQTIQCDIASPPVRDGMFDYVFCAGLLHHFPNLLDVLSPIRRLLKSRGYLFIYEPNGTNLVMNGVNTLAHLIFPASFLMRMGGTPNERLHTILKYRRTLKMLKFRIERSGTSFVPNRTFLPFGLNKLIGFLHAVKPSEMTDTHILMTAQRM